MAQKKKTWSLRLSQAELVHLRDLLSICLPPDMGTTLSQALAEAEGTGPTEAQLWQRLVRICKKADVPLGDRAPDFTVAPTAIPAMSVFRIAENSAQGAADDEEAAAALFAALKAAEQEEEE